MPECTCGRGQQDSGVSCMQVHHRLFTCDTLKDTHPTGILSQSDIVKLMWHHKVELTPLLSSTVEELGLCAVCDPPFAHFIPFDLISLGSS
jgi:hypothetical protein